MFETVEMLKALDMFEMTFEFEMSEKSKTLEMSEMMLWA